MKAPLFLFDAAWARRNIPIRDVLAALGLATDGRRFRCWLADEVRHERQFSISIFHKKNQARCWGCHSLGLPSGRLLSVIDLVMEVPGCNVREALSWLGERFPIPTGEFVGGKVKSIVAPEPLTLESFMLSPSYPRLSLTAKAIAGPVIATLIREGKQDVGRGFTVSELQRLSGIGSKQSASRGLRELQEAGVLRVGMEPTRRVSARGIPYFRMYARLRDSGGMTNPTGG